MILSDDEKSGIGIALNESALLGLELSIPNAAVAATFSVVTVNEQSVVPDDRRVQIIFYDVGRICASLRNGRWDDENAAVSQFSPESILEIVQGFGGCSVYGWEFIDCDNKKFLSWKDRLSMECLLEEGKMTHTIDLFQSGVDRHLDLRIYFDSFKIFTPSYGEISLQQFIDNGQRGWDEIHAGNKAVQDKYGIYPSADYKFKRD